MRRRGGIAINIGNSEEDPKSSVDGLSRLLSNTYGLYFNASDFQWNVTGPMFRRMHWMFEARSNELRMVVDSIA